MLRRSGVFSHRTRDIMRLIALAVAKIGFGGCLQRGCAGKRVAPVVGVIAAAKGRAASGREVKATNGRCL